MSSHINQHEIVLPPFARLGRRLPSICRGSRSIHLRILKNFDIIYTRDEEKNLIQSEKGEFDYGYKLRKSKVDLCPQSPCKGEFPVDLQP